MCGICGAIGIDSPPAAESAVRRMLSALVHRGPDAEGFLLAPNAALGMRRLSIIDLPGGGQPVWNETGTVAVFYNGEIYNFRELRAELESAGHKFRTRSDTEVVVHAWEQWGEDCPRRFHGMFAFAIVELPGCANSPSAPATKVFLARDPLGIKPLYYFQSGKKFLFASEVRALLSSGHVARAISAPAVASYLLFGSVGEPMSLLDGVRSLPPGHSLSLDLTEVSHAAQAEPRPYWDAASEFRAFAAADKNAKPPSNPAATVRSLLEASVRGHLIADVPVGVFLSSGIDSTALAALASTVQSGIHTFTVAFPDVQFSESEVARRTAARLGTEHSELNLSDADMTSRLDEAVTAFDQPSMDGINSYFVSWAARQAGLKVALSGLGSDEIFGGYSAFRDTSKIARLAGVAKYLPSAARSALTAALEKTNALSLPPDKFRKAGSAFLDPDALAHPYYFTRTLFPPRTVSAALAQPQSAWAAAAWSKWLAHSAAQAKPLDRFTQISWLELRSYMASTLLRDIDSMSMASSLEVRVPFLDVPLVKYVLSLPESAKRCEAQPKSLLTAALGDLLPREIVSQTKRTFTFPWETWLRGKLGDRVSAALRDWSPALAPHIAPAFPQKIWSDFLAGRTSWSRPWSLFVLNEWAKRNLAP